MYCQKCGGKHDPNASFCPACGHDLQAPPKHAGDSPARHFTVDRVFSSSNFKWSTLALFICITLYAVQIFAFLSEVDAAANTAGMASMGSFLGGDVWGVLNGGAAIEQLQQQAELLKTQMLLCFLVAGYYGFLAFENMKKDLFVLGNFKIDAFLMIVSGIMLFWNTVFVLGLYATVVAFIFRLAHSILLSKSLQASQDSSLFSENTKAQVENLSRKTVDSAKSFIDRMGDTGNVDSDSHGGAFLNKAYLRQLLLTREGRIGRKEYWLGQLGLTATALIPSVLLEMMHTGLGNLAWLAIVYPSLMICIKRAHDRNHSGHWCWLCLIPILNLWLGIELGFLKGTEGPNRFGEDPLETSRELNPDTPSVATARAATPPPLEENRQNRRDAAFDHPEDKPAVG